LELERQRLRAEQEADERARKMEHAIELERQRLQAEREAAERAREAALDMARQAELAATRAAAEAAQAQALAQAQAKARDNRSGWQKGSDAAGSVAGFGCGCIGYIVLAIVLFFGLLLLLAALGK
jgi:membrane protein involved in colicin uptake